MIDKSLIKPFHATFGWIHFKEPARQMLKNLRGTDALKQEFAHGLMLFQTFLVLQSSLQTRTYSLTSTLTMGKKQQKLMLNGRGLIQVIYILNFCYKYNGLHVCMQICRLVCNPVADFTLSMESCVFFTNKYIQSRTKVKVLHCVT